MGRVPKEPSPPSVRMSDYTWHFYGAPGVGKTTLANQFRKPIFIATESGTEAMWAAAAPASNWTELKAIISELQEGNHSYETVVLDTNVRVRWSGETRTRKIDPIPGVVHSGGGVVLHLLPAVDFSSS